MSVIPGEPLMTLPASALRHAEQKREEAARDEPPAWLLKATPEQIDGILQIWPRCAVCNRPVEKLGWTTDPGKAEIVYTARCHGAVETTRIPLAAALRGELAGGVAFAAKAVEGAA